MSSAWSVQMLPMLLTKPGGARPRCRRNCDRARRLSSACCVRDSWSPEPAAVESLCKQADQVVSQSVSKGGMHT